MAQLSSVEAAFHGFGVIKRDPLTFLGVAVLLSGLAIAFVMSFVPGYARLLQTMYESGGEPDPQVLLPVMMQTWGRIALVQLAMIPVYALALGALNRSLLFGASKGWALGLKISMDEVRVILVTIAGYIGCIVLMIWIGVRMCYAGAASVGEGRFVIFESWTMTKGNFWNLFLAYLLLYVVMWLIEMVVFAVCAIAAAPWIASQDWEHFDFTVFERLSLGPIVIVGGIVYGLIATFMMGAFLGVGAKGYLNWKESAQAAPAAV